MTTPEVIGKVDRGAGGEAKRRGLLSIFAFLLIPALAVPSASAQWDPQPEPVPPPPEPPGDDPAYVPEQPGPQPPPVYDPQQPAYQPTPQPAPQQPVYQPPPQQPAPPPPSYQPVPPLKEPRLLTKRGTMQLGGTLLIDYNHQAQKGSNWKNGTMIEVSPALGYFVADGLELLAAVYFARGLGQLYDDETSFGAGLGIKYHFDLGKVFLYLGAGLGAEFLYPDGGDLQPFLTLQLPFGVLIPLNQHLAIDVGMIVNTAFYLDEDWAMILDLPIGYLGVQGYF